MVNFSPPMNIWCVGRNYRDHALELNNPVPTRPLIFLKAGSCATVSQKIYLPTWSKEIHHECEIAVQLDHRGDPKSLGLALDLTARDAQSEAKKKGEPWTLAKSFTGACPLTPMVPFDSYEAFANLGLEFKINGKLVQQGSAQQMIFNLQTLVQHIKNLFPVQENDLLLTGTPAGVGPLFVGQKLEAHLSCGLSWNWEVA